jgi:hypothetical protein
LRLVDFADYLITMKKLFLFFAGALGVLSFVGCHEHPLFAQERVEPARIEGKWQMTMDTPHGSVQGPLQVKQDGAKLSGTYSVEHMGELSFTGTVDGKKVSISMEVPGGEQKFGFSGTVDGDKMSGTTEMGGNWKASR